MNISVRVLGEQVHKNLYEAVMIIMIMIWYNMGMGKGWIN